MTKRLDIEYVREYMLKEGFTLESEVYKNNYQKLNVACSGGHQYSVSWSNFKRGRRCPKCIARYSKAEKHLLNKLKEYLPETILVKENDREAIGPKELDMYFPEYSLAIEYCGIYWHTEQILSKRFENRKIFSGVTGKNYHRKKLDSCNNLNIRLLTVFEDEYINKPDICIYQVLRLLNIQTRKISARKCSVKQITSKEANAFLLGNNLQGKSNNKIAFGLFYNDELVEVMTLGSLSRAHTAKNTIELKRLSTKMGYSIIGGESRLFNLCKEYAKENDYDKIRAHCDLRWGTTAIYKKLGFDYVTETKYTPHYVKGQQRFRNQALRKTVEERLTGKTEWELRQEQGYTRIYDCGHQTWDYNL